MLSRFRAMLLGTCCLLVFQTGMLYAQAHVSRFVSFRNFSDSASVGSLFSRSGFAGEFQRAFNGVTPPPVHDMEEMEHHLSRDQAWSIKFGGYLELYRFNSRTTLTGTFFHELSANAMNDIGFNPRAAQWEEQILLRDFLRISDDMSTTLGVFHRCKHDIDNSDDEMNDTVNTQLVRKRTIILSGFSLALAFTDDDGIQLFNSITTRGELRGEYYLYAEDYRYPQTHFGNSWKNMKGAIQATIQFSYPLTTKTDVWLKSYSSNIYIGADTEQRRSGGFEQNARLELGLTFKGKNAAFSLYVLNERLFDDITRVSADPTNIWALGIRTTPLEFW